MTEVKKYVNPNELECRSGVVESVFGNTVMVRITREKACNSCAAKSHCGALFGSDTVLEIETDPRFKVGDHVEIGLNPSAILSASTLFFVVPVILFLAGLLIGYGTAESAGFDEQWWGFGLGSLLMAGGFVVLKLLSPRMVASQKYEPVITRRLDS